MPDEHKLPKEVSPLDLTEECLRNVAEFRNLLSGFRPNEKVEITLPFSKIPKGLPLYLVQWFDACPQLKVTIVASKEEHDARPDISEIKKVKWKDIK